MSRKPPKITLKQALGLIGPYVRRKLLEQVRSVALIILYLIFFQTAILGIAIAEAAMIAAGLSLVILGLTFFMEGILLGLMPLGEVIGVKLPQKGSTPVILAFAFVLGVGATLAEPAIGVLKDTGAAVKAWEAPLLFLLLTKDAAVLSWTIAAGVGVAVILGMLRFLYQWPLKGLLYALVGPLLITTLLGYVLAALGVDQNLHRLTGLAWDSGAVTTGPVTVPLVLALGLGISRIVSGGESGAASGFGVVALASLVPVLAVQIAGFVLCGSVPQPMSATAFFSAANRAQAVKLFRSREEMTGHALFHSNFDGAKAGLQPVEALFANDRAQVRSYVVSLAGNAALRQAAFGSPSREAVDRWVALQGDGEMRLAVFGNAAAAKVAVDFFSRVTSAPVEPRQLVFQNAGYAVLAIVPLTLFLLTVLLLMRESLPRADEVLLGVVFAVLGLGIFNIGIAFGLTKLGNQVGAKLPSSFSAIDLPEARKTLNNFDPGVVLTAATGAGESERFFYTREGSGYVAVPYAEERFDPSTRQYTFTPRHGPLFGESGMGGMLVVLLFAFLMGYGATLAEPTLNALGLTVEEITVGTFRKAVLMQTVAVGVGAGLALGVAKILWNISLGYLLVPPYCLLLYLTFISTEEFVNIAWDSAGVTTGPITVPLVLAMGLGIGGQVQGVVESFGILAMASVTPILAVLLVGLGITRKRQADLAEVEREEASREPWPGPEAKGGAW